MYAQLYRHRLAQVYSHIDTDTNMHTHSHMHSTQMYTHRHEHTDVHTDKQTDADTHVAGDAGEQVLGHILTVEQPENDPPQVLLIDEAILIEICRAEHWLSRDVGPVPS